mmetsp:Transcript_19907/g.37428  ORF Transcript_19907/g.37428 Transcript_19907/m.37428 type:complete len:114 (-) Transcript_19907:180-521(-)
MEVRKYTRWTGGGIGEQKIALSDIGPFMAYATCKLAKDRGLDKVQFLAIFDSEFQHRNLVRYYKFIGCKPVRVVGEELSSDYPARLLYGGIGTLMEGEVETSLRRWAKRFRKT